MQGFHFRCGLLARILRHEGSELETWELFAEAPARQAVNAMYVTCCGGPPGGNPFRDGIPAPAGIGEHEIHESSR